MQCRFSCDCGAFDDLFAMLKADADIFDKNGAYKC